MNSAFSQQMIVSKETNIELYSQIQQFVNDMERHIESFPDYTYKVEMLGGEPGEYSARLIITKYGNRKTETTEGDTSSYGIL